MPQLWFTGLAIFLFGLAIGSFLNVCIYRLPREGMSLVSPPSSCPGCGRKIRPWENIPLLSYMALRGRCRGCGMTISLRYPFVELLNGLFYLGLLLRFGFGWHLLFQCALVSALIVITFIDLDLQIIPDEISLPGIVVGLIGGVFFLPDPFDRALALGWKSSVTGALAGFISFLLIAEIGYRVFKKEAMGGGDIKLMAMLGAFLGYKGVLAVTLLGSLTGSVIGIAIMVLAKDERGKHIPFGPFLALGALIALFYGQEILIWYLRLGYGRL